MPYDTSNLGNVTNYLSQQRAAGGYVPTNGALGNPSMGWDGWNNYNANQTYSAASAGQSPQSAPVGNTGGPMPGRGPGQHGPGLHNVMGWLQNKNGDKTHGPQMQQPRVPAGGQSPQTAQIPRTPYTGTYNNLNAGAPPPPPLSQTLQGVQNYGQQYGQNAYQFMPGINDYNTKLQNWQNIANITGQTPEQVAMASSGYGLDYWQKMQEQYDQGLHPTAS